MLRLLAKNWWMLVLRGILAIIFGILALVWPTPTLRVLVLFFGVYALVDGLFTLISALGTRRDVPWWWVLLEGIFGIAAGVATFVWPNITALVLLILIAAWAVITGLFEILAAIELRKKIEGEGWLILGGVLSIIFGVVLFLQPGSGALAVIWLIGAYTIIFGIFLIAMGFRLRAWHTSMRTSGVA